MRGILLVSHGQYAEAFKGSLKMIAGEVTNLYSCCLLPTDGPEQFKEKVRALKPELDQYDEVLVFSDLFGGSPCINSFAELFADPKCNFIAGMNFPMVLTALLSESESVESLIAQGREGIADVKTFMGNTADEDEDE